VKILVKQNCEYIGKLETSEKADPLKTQNNRVSIEEACAAKLQTLANDTKSYKANILDLGRYVEKIIWGCFLLTGRVWHSVKMARQLCKKMNQEEPFKPLPLPSKEEPSEELKTANHQLIQNNGPL